ncbi:MAG: MlaD family protein [Verrucomicrobiales bacterium]|nr:MlaD family protein [Verrucomicrobiales bacterium]
MKQTKRIWEIIVGVFVVMGILVSIFTAAWMIRDGLTKTYPITIHVNEVGGLEKGAPVEMGGLKIGEVSDRPRFKNDYTALLVPLEIESGVQIPEGVMVLIDRREHDGSSFVRMTLPKEAPARFVQADDYLNGFRLDREELKQKGLNDSLEKFQNSMESLNSTSTTLERLITLLENKGEAGVPAPRSLSSINRSMESFEQTNLKMSHTIDRLDALLLTTGEGMKRVDSSITKFDRTMAEFDTMAKTGDRSFQKIYDLADRNTETSEDFHLAVNEFRSFLYDLDPIVSSIRDGNGLLKTLAEDECLDHDIKSFANKLEKHGVLFYPREKKRSSEPRPGNHRLLGRR